jgi:hypothetical protein
LAVFFGKDFGIGSGRPAKGAGTPGIAKREKRATIGQSDRKPRFFYANAG